jgi:hypothetical protein
MKMETWKRTEKKHPEKYGLEKEIWYLNPKNGKYLMITKEKNSIVWEGEYNFSHTSTGKWGGYSENETLYKALNDIERKENDYDSTMRIW